jgi:hypothetical protein
MRLFRRLVFGGFALMALNHGAVFSQATYSPYSIIGIGDIVDPGVPAVQGMAGLAISNGSYWYLNNTNPALLHYNAVALFSAGIVGATKTIQQTGFEPYNSSSGQLQHAAMAFPLIARKLSFSLVLQPYSVVGYEFSYSVPVPNGGTNYTTFNTGDGGFNELKFSLGGLVYKKLSLGVKASYVFSSIRKEFTTFVEGLPLGTSNYLAVYSERQSANDFRLGFGIAYNFKIGENKLNVGAVYDLKANIKGNYFLRLEQQTLNGSAIFADTLADNTRRYYTLPANIGLGISYGREGKWLVGVDYRTQDWNVFDGSVSSIPEDFERSNKYILGAEFTPDVNSITNYAKRVTYRVGASYYQTPYVVNGTQINDFGINFGWSLPVARFSSLDFGFQVGNRGTLDNDLIREDYFKIFFGATFNDNRWFIRPKYN